MQHSVAYSQIPTIQMTTIAAPLHHKHALVWVFYLFFHDTVNAELYIVQKLLEKLHPLHH